LHEIESHLVTGSILACLTVLLFMRSWRSTLIAAVAIPASIIGTFAFMKAFGFTLNNVTMLALVLMVGVVIDDAIVVLENVFRFVEEKGASPVEAAIEGTREIGLAVLATTLSLVIVFLPVSFLSSVTGRLLFEFGITASVAILISMVISFTLTPMMCSRLLKRKTDSDERGKSDSKRGLYRQIERAYLFSLKGALRFRWLTLLIVTGLILSNIPLYSMIKQDYIPTNVDESEFEVRLSAGQGTSMPSMDEAMELVESRVQEISGVKTVLATVGTGGLGGVNRGRLYVQLQDIESRTFSFFRLARSILAGDWQATFRGNFSQREKMTEVRNALKELPGIRASVRNQTSLRQGAPVDIDFSITGANIDQLVEYSAKLQDAAANIPGLVDLDRTLRVDKPEMVVRIDRERAAAMGVSVTEIADTLRVAVGGDDRVSRYRDASVDDAYDVELRLEGIDRNDPESISQLMVRIDPNAGELQGTRLASTVMASIRSGDAISAPSMLTRIDNLIRFSSTLSSARIDRLDRQRMVAVRANIDSGYSLSGRIEALETLSREIGLPEGFETRVMGGGRELERTLEEFKWVFVLSFVFMYIVLAAQFEHLLHPITILLSLPIAVPFGLLGLYWGGESLNVYSALGLLVLFGVVKKAAILQVDHTRTLRASGMEKHQAILAANADRLRPILMTTLSFVAGMIPLLIGTGPGAEERRSIATLAVCGQTLSLLLTLLAVPVMYSMIDDLHAFFKRRSSAPNP
jgi:HAE1 family hydrophobic/amphiphilic exporter-1